MKTRLLSLLFILIWFSTGLSQSIVVNDPADAETNLTAEEMVEQVLASGGGNCVDINFINLQENPAGVGNLNQRSWGYFRNNGTGFPFEEGIILASGLAVTAEGPNDQGGASTGGGWAGDNDIETILNNLTGTTVETNDATVFEFTFSSVFPQVSFEYIFASEEYEDDFECDDDFRDGFAFLVSGPGITNDSGAPFGGTNIAAIPGSANVPVSTLTIHSDTFPICGSEVEGVNFFPDLYVSNQGANNTDEFQYDGRTVELNTLTLNIIPGETYTMKLVIADRGDNDFDSAVFLNAGSLNLGVNGGSDVTVQNNNTSCEGDVVTLTANPFNTDSTIEYDWFLEDPGGGPLVLIADNMQSIDVNIAGTYVVIATFTSLGSCTAEDSVIVDFFPQPIVAAIEDIIACDDGSGFAMFDTTNIQDDLLNGQTAVDVINYFDGSGNPLTSPLPNPFNSMSDVITVEFINMVGGCMDTGTFNLVVASGPDINPVADLMSCDPDSDGIADFVTAGIEDTILGGLTGLDVTYEDGSGNPLPSPLPDPLQNTIPNLETITVTVTDPMTSCFSTVTFDLVVTPLPVFNPIADLVVCDDDGFADFDTTGIEAAILGGQTGFTVTYEDGNGNPIASPLPNPLSNVVAFSETITVTISSANGLCEDVGTFNLVANLIPTANPVTDLLGCDSDGDGITEFNTSGVEAEILGGQTGLVVSYVDGSGNPLSSPLPNPFFNITPGGETLVATVTNPATGCFSTTNIVLNIINPEATDPGDLIECDNDLDGVATFNLLSLSTLILNGQDPTFFFVSYHNNAGDAAADINAINPADMFVSAGQTVFARVDNGLNPGDSTCDAITNFDLILVLPPTVALPPDLEVCDIDNDGSFDFELGLQNFLFDGGDPTLIVTYHLTQEDADNGILEIDQTTFINNEPFTQTIYVRVENGDGCFTVVPYVLQVLDTPILNDAPTALLVCDVDEDGFATFDLTLSELEILDGLDPLVFTFEWFVTLADAQAGFPAIGDPTAFATMSTTVYAVVTEEGQSATARCPSEPVALELIVEPLPVVPGLMTRIEVCDDEASPGGNTDGLTIFDLNSLNDEITGGDLTLNVTYHVDQASADAGTPELPDPYTIGSGPDPGPDETIFVRVEDLTTGCFMTATITLAVIPLPSPIVVAPELCDISDGIVDNMAIFDLTDASISGAIINGEPISLTFHEVEQDAIDGVNAVADPTMYSAIDGTVLYVRALNDAINDFTMDQCFSVIEITLTVLPSPELPATLPDLAECDEDGDGEVFIDLTQNETLIFGTNPIDFILSYHLSEMDANDGVNAIATSELTSFSVTADTVIWVRLEDNITGCHNTISFNALIVNIPLVNPGPFELEACDEELGINVVGDGLAVFNLTDLDTDLIGLNANVEVLYFENQADVDANNPIDPSDSYESGTATIIAVIQSTQAGFCTNQTTVDLIVNPLPTLISDPLPNAISCDDDNDGFGMFDLQAYADLILNGSTTIDLAFYETLEDALANDPADAIDISVLFDNISMVMPELYVVATDIDTGCNTIFVFTLEVHPVPIIDQPAQDISMCDDIAPMGTEEFDLTVNTPIVLGSQDPLDFMVSYHLSQADADTGANAIPNPDSFESGSQTIYVRIVFTDGSACFVTDDFEIIVEPLPVIVEPTDSFDLCDDDSDEVAVFDLTTLIDGVTAGDPLLGVTFFASQDDVDNDIPITNPESYENTSNPQTIQIVVNTLAGCTAQTQITLRVLPLPTPETFDPADIVLCDDDDDGMLTLDDEIQDVIDEIIGSENVSVLLYESLALAELGDPLDAITLPYTNSVPGGQTIYARVNSNAADNFCFVIVEFDIIINPLPGINPNREDPYALCSDNDETGEISEDLATITNLLSPPQDLADFTITYHNTQVEAEEQDDPLSLPIAVDEQGTGSDFIFVRVENTLTGCFVISSIEIIVEASPMIASNPGDLTQCADDPGINGIPVQNQSTFNLTQQDAVIGNTDPDTIIEYFTDADLTELITNPDAFVATGTSDIGINVGISQQTIYATVTNTVTGCMSVVVSFELFILELPFTDLDNLGGGLCVDQATGQVLDPPVLDATPENDISGDDVSYAYFWTLDGQSILPDSNTTPNLLTVNQVGTYEVEVVATYDDPANMGSTMSCSYTAQTTFSAISAPIFEVEVVEESFNASGLYTVNVINVSGADDGPYEFSLDGGPFQTGVAGNPSTTFTDVLPGEHTIIGRRLGAPEVCGETAVDFGIIDFPRFFTPNEDGFNETWNILGLGANPNLNANVFIFNREGKLLKQLSPQGPGWDGTFNGRAVPSNDYWFRVEFTEPSTGLPRVFSNHFTLKR